MRALRRAVKIQIGLTFLMPAYPGCPGKETVKRVSVCLVVAAWHSGNVVGRINEATLRRARLVLGWSTVFCGQTSSVFHQATQANSASYPQWDGE